MSYGCCGGDVDVGGRALNAHLEMLMSTGRRIEYAGCSCLPHGLEALASYSGRTSVKFQNQQIK